MIKENRVSKYLLYAIGEIILVVIGILIALQINNWNGQKKLKEKEMALLSEMCENLKLDSASISRNIWLSELVLGSSNAVLSQLEERIP